MALVGILTHDFDDLVHELQWEVVIFYLLQNLWDDLLLRWLPIQFILSRPCRIHSVAQLDDGTVVFANINLSLHAQPASV